MKDIEQLLLYFDTAGISFICVFAMKEKMSIIKDLYSNKKIKITPPEINSENIKKENKQLDKEFLKYIEIFETRLKEQAPHISLSNFYKNLETLIIKLKEPFQINLFNYTFNFEYEIFPTSAMSYCTDKNKIVGLKRYLGSLPHELLHMSSTYKDKRKCFCGFWHEKNKYSIGRGLNEGYTELLVERYFSDIDKYNWNSESEKIKYTTIYEKEISVTDENYIPYQYEKHIAKHIEMLIDQKEMEQYYFTGNLYALINSLSSYASKDDILLFLKKLDFLSEYKKYPKFLLGKNHYRQSIDFINEFLTECYIIKNKISCDDDEKILKNINSFISSLSAFKYPFIENDDLLLDDKQKILKK